jgi:UDP-GlcNAc3NAcA epimerase
MKIVFIIGARPQFIKHAPLGNELAKSHDTILVHTGQHYDYNMNKIFFDELNIPAPKYNLGIGSGTHAYQTGEMMKGIEDILVKEKPDLVVIFGDTNSTLAGALSAVKLGLRIAHVEAGLRMFDKFIPEEINRIVADRCSDYLFCPTQTAVDNLKKEGISSGIYLTGDVMVDALNNNKEIAEKSLILSSIGLTSKQYLLVTVHRASNTDNRQNLTTIINTLFELSRLNEKIVFPVHPRTKKLLNEYNLMEIIEDAITIIEPVGYIDFLKLLNHAKKVLTDSGGIQKEAYILKTPCITIMDSTPWLETVEDGWNVLAGTDIQKILQLTKTFEPRSAQRNVFGNNACQAIAEILEKQ